MKKYLLALVVIIALALIAWRSGKVPVLNNLLPAGDGQPVACTEEAKQCPDGSYVGRTGPKCEFTACPAVDDKTGWQTYKNEQYGFEFQYPKDKFTYVTTDRVDETVYKISACSRGSEGPCNEVISVTIFSNPSRFSPFDWLAGQGAVPNDGDRLQAKNNYPDLENGELLGSPYVKFTNYYCDIDNLPNVPDCGRERVYMIGEGDLIYKINSGQYTEKNENNLNDFNNIFSTFKIKNDVLMTGWKTYHNEEYGFQFNYPNYLGRLNVLDDGSIAISESGSAKVVVSFPESLSMKKVIENYVSKKGYKTVEVSVGGVQGLSVESPQIGHMVFVPSPSKQMIVITGDGLQGYQQLLSSFEFTK